MRRIVTDLFPTVSGHSSSEKQGRFRTTECPKCRLLMSIPGYCHPCGEYRATV